MLDKIKYVIGDLWYEQRSTFWLLLLSFILVIFIIIFVLTTTANAESFDTCIAKCKTDVMYIDECIKDERRFWEPTVSDINLKHSCLDLIRNERFACRSICEKNEAQKSYAVDYYDKNVRHFPETIQ